ncbi:MAG: hypothetical protein J6J43_00020 [Oscillospiraceae bacterium]|nr:hypothetical protein [Oscillospiraceae bacterium]
MKKNWGMGVFLWAVGVIVAHILLVYLPNEMTTAVWITYGMSVLVFLLHLMAWMICAAKQGADNFLYVPNYMLSVMHMVLQLVLCLLFLVFSGASEKVTVLCNGGLLLVMSVLMALSAIGKRHIENIEKRQNNNHREL